MIPQTESRSFSRNRILRTWILFFFCTQRRTTTTTTTLDTHRYSHEGSNRLVRAIPISKLDIDSTVTASHITKIDEEYLHWNKFPLLLNNPPPLRSIMLLFPSEDERDMWDFTIDQQKKKLNTPQEMKRRSTLTVARQRKSTMFKGDAAHVKWSLAAQIFATVRYSL